MRTISLKLPAALHARLDRRAKQSKQSKSNVVRAALEQYLNDTQRSAAAQPVSALKLAGDLAGCVTGPGDLSTNKKYMEGFGK